MEAFEPRIVAFLCNWCSYTGADLAGTSRKKYRSNIIPIRVMCSGRVDPEFVLKAFQQGADGVLICGCHPGDCHYINGNHKTLGRYPVVKRMLTQFGIHPDRFNLEWVSAAEGERYTQVVEEMIDRCTALGPLDWSGRLADEITIEQGV